MKPFVTVPLLLVVLIKMSSATIDTSTCGITKGCVSNPIGCEPSQSSCVYFTWQWIPNSNHFQMELSGGSGSNTYAGVAFGQVEGMEDADLYYCTGGKLQSASITTTTRPTDSTSTTDGPANVTAAVTSGVAKCTFTRPASVTKTVSGGTSITFDLSKESYYILLARGPLNSGALAYHGINRRITSNLVNMTTTGIESTTSPNIESTASTSTRPTNSDQDCGKTVGCFKQPTGCSSSSPNCAYFRWSYDTASNRFNMTISGGNGINSYVGVAFGQVPRMERADLYYCTGGKLQSSLIISRSSPTNLNNADAGLENIVATAENGVASCSFTRPANVTKSASGTTITFNLATGQYFILLARGDANAGDVTYHKANRGISANTVDMTSFQGVAAAGHSVMVKAHGSLMIVAWLLLSNLGVSIARHFKPLFPDVQPGGIKLWFHLHRFAMVTVLLSTAVAFIIIFVHVNGFSSERQNHAIIGIIVMALALTNPIMALMRPHPNTPNRPVFNWMHFSVGTIARILSIANLFLGVQAVSLTNWIAVLGGFVGWVVLMEIVLELLSFRYKHTVLGGGRNEPPKDVSNPDMQMEDPKRPLKGQSVKTTVLVIYALGLLGFAIAFFVDISNA